MKRLLLVTCVALAAMAQNRAPGNETIKKDELSADLHFLASDEMRGRLTDTPENLLAATWIESRFRRLGLKQVTGSYAQRYNLTWSTLGKRNEMRVISGGVVSEAQVLSDFMPLFFSPSAKTRAKVAFARFGIEAPELQWDDLRGNLRGAIVLMLEGEPGANDPKSMFDGVVTSIHADSLRKALNAQARGAAGVLLVSGQQSENRFGNQARAYWPVKPPHLKRYALTSWTERLRIPVASISAAVAQQLLGARVLADLAKEAAKPV